MLNVCRALLFLVIAAAACAPAAPTSTPAPTASTTPTPTDLPTPRPTLTPLAVPLAQEAAPSASVRVIHAASGQPPVDVYIEGLVVAPYLSYRQYTSAAPVAAGAYTVRVYPAGSRPAEAEPLLAASAEFPAGSAWLLTVASAGGDLTLLVHDDMVGPLEQGQSRVSFVHALDGVGEITVRQRGVNLTPPLPLGVINTIATTPASEIVFDFVSAGLPLLTYPLDLRSRTAYTLVLAGAPAAPEIIRVEARMPGWATVRAVHGAAALGAVDVYLGDTLLAAALDYTRSSPRETVAAGAYRAAVYPAGASPAASEPLASGDILAAEDGGTTLVILGAPPSAQLAALRDDLAPTAPGAARVTFVNTLAESPRLEAIVNSGAVALPVLHYGDLSRPLDLQTGSGYTFYWNAAGADESAASLEIAQDVLFEAGRSYLYLVTGRIDTPPVILSESVGVLSGAAAAAAPQDATPTPLPPRPAYVTAVNAAFESGPLAVLLDGVLLAERLDYGDASPAQPAAEGVFTVEVRSANAPDPLFQDQVVFDAGVSYTLVVLGYGLERILVLPVPEPEAPAGDAPLARLINVSAGAPVNLGLAYAISVNTPAAASRLSSPPQTSALSGTPVTPTYRQSIGFGVQPVPNADSVPPGGASAPGLLSAGVFDLLILDADAAAVAATIASVSLQAGQRYDVYALQQPDSSIVQGFVVPVPVNPG